MGQTSDTVSTPAVGIVASDTPKTLNTPLDESDSGSNPQQGTRSSSPCMSRSHSPKIDAVPGSMRVESNGTEKPQTVQRTENSSTYGGPTKRTEPVRNMKIPPTHKDSRKLFVGGLPTDITSEEFFTFFIKFGAILDSVVMFDRETRRARGFGFVTFEDPSVCQRLLLMGGNNNKKKNGGIPRSGRLEMRGKMIEIKAAQPKASDSKVTKTTYSTQHEPYRPHGPESDRGHSHYNHNQFDSNHYDHGAKLPATLPRSYQPSMYGYNAPPTPIPYATPATPVSPQAAFDMAHHMMFYSHLLATPTIMQSPMMSPIMYPAAMTYDYNHYAEHFYPYNNAAHPTFPVAEEPEATVISNLEVPSIDAGKPFKIGGASFYPDNNSPTLTVGKPGIQGKEELCGMVGPPETTV